MLGKEREMGKGEIEEGETVGVSGLRARSRDSFSRGKVSTDNKRARVIRNLAYFVGEPAPLISGVVFPLQSSFLPLSSFLLSFHTLRCSFYNEDGAITSETVVNRTACFSLFHGATSKTLRRFPPALRLLRTDTNQARIERVTNVQSHCTDLVSGL